MRDEIDCLVDKFSLLLQSGPVFIAVKRNKDIFLELRMTTTQEQRVETCKIISEYLLKVVSKIDIEGLQRKEFDVLRKIIDEHYLYVKKVTREKGIDESLVFKLRAQTLSLKLGGKVPEHWLSQEKNRAFFLFVVRNFLHHDFSALRLQVPFEYDKGPSLPIYRREFGLVWLPFNKMTVQKKEKNNKLVFTYLNEVIFETNLRYELGQDYSCFFNGIQKYNIYFAQDWIPYDKRDPNEWGKKYILEVWTSAMRHYKDKPSMFSRTHAYMILLDKEGYVRSVGQDALIDIKDYKVHEVLATKPGYGKIATPDKYVLYPTNSRQFWHVSIELTKEQHDKMIELVEKDKKNPHHFMSVQRKNCVSYTLKMLREVLGFEVDGSIHGMHIFFKAFLPNKYYRMFMKWFVPWYQRRSPRTQKMLYFFPPYYLLFALVVTCGAAISQNNYRGIKDYRLKDVLLFPWLHSVDHPLALHRVLEKHTSEDGFVHIKKDQFV